MMPRCAFPLFVLVLTAIAACSEPDSRHLFYGIGSVERSDQRLALHHYDNVLLPTDTSWFVGLADGDRVYFESKVSLAQSDTAHNTYDAEFVRISANLLMPALLRDSVFDYSDSLQRLARSAEGFQAQDVHVCQDWLHRGFFEATAIYPGADDGANDFLRLVRDQEDEDGRVVFWLRLARAQTDSALFVYKTISVPLNQFCDSASERMLFRVKRINTHADTIVTDYVYSYQNFMR